MNSQVFNFSGVGNAASTSLTINLSGLTFALI